MDSTNHSEVPSPFSDGNLGAASFGRDPSKEEEVAPAQLAPVG